MNINVFFVSEPVMRQIRKFLSKLWKYNSLYYFFFRYLSSHPKNSRFHTSEFCGLNT